MLKRQREGKEIDAASGEYREKFHARSGFSDAPLIAVSPHHVRFAMSSDAESRKMKCSWIVGGTYEPFWPIAEKRRVIRGSALLVPEQLCGVEEDVAEFELEGGGPTMATASKSAYFWPVYRIALEIKDS